MKTYRFREVFTVTRTLSKSTLQDARRDFRPVEDETGEFLYGGTGQEEEIEVRLEMLLKRGCWVPV